MGHKSSLSFEFNQLTCCGRAGNSGGTWEPSSQKQFGLAESFCGFEILTKLNSQVFLKFLPKFVVLDRACQFLQYPHDFLCWNTLTILFLWTHTHHQKYFCAISHVFNPIYSLFLQKIFSKNIEVPTHTSHYLQVWPGHWRYPHCQGDCPFHPHHHWCGCFPWSDLLHHCLHPWWYGVEFLT